MYKLCKTEQSAKRQREIEKVLFDLMMKKSYPDITVTEICDALSMPRKAFYRYFDSKDDTLVALIDHTLQDFGSFGASDSELERFAAYWQLQKPLLDVLHANQMDNLLTDRALHLVLEEDYDFRRLLGAESDESGKMVLHFTVQGILSIIQSWHQNKYHLSTGQIAVLLRRVLHQPLMAAHNNASPAF